MSAIVPCDCGRPKRAHAEACRRCDDLDRELLTYDVACATREGRSAEAIARDLGITERTVVRIRASLRSRGSLEVTQEYSENPGGLGGISP